MTALLEARQASKAFGGGIFDKRVTGPAMPTAATTSPESSRIGAAMQTMPISLSSSSMAQPRWRVAASSLMNFSGLMMVLGVRGARPAAITRATISSGAKARMACPSAVQ